MTKKETKEMNNNNESSTASKQTRAELSLAQKNARNALRLQKKQENIQKAQAEREKILNSVEYQVKKLAQEQKFNENWYKLDNAGLIYAAISSDTTYAVYSLTAQMINLVDPIILQKAVNEIVPRFPTITASLRTGMFWYYLEKPRQPIVVEKQTGRVCEPISLDHRRSMIRVTYFEKMITVSLFHTATDGTGGTIFLNSLIARYLQLQGIEIKDMTNCLDARDKPRYEEVTDEFQNIADFSTIKKEKLNHCYHIGGKQLPNKNVINRKLIISVSKIKEVAKTYDATITQFLLACLFQSIRNERKVTNSKNKKNIRIILPTNLRKIFDKPYTLRNFVSYIFFVCPDNDDFNATIKYIKERISLKHNKKSLQGMVSGHIKPETNRFLKYAPLFLKNLAMKIGYQIESDSVTTVSLSNIGFVPTPVEFNDYVLRYEFAFGHSLLIPYGISAVSFGDCLVLNIASKVEDVVLERSLTTLLSSLGVNIVVESD
ncbi:MAG: hypothetical protein RRY18_01740, partial [Clostridia bacterium]